MGGDQADGMECAELAPAGERERTFDPWGGYYSGSKLGALSPEVGGVRPGEPQLWQNFHFTTAAARRDGLALPLRQLVQNSHFTTLATAAARQDGLALPLRQRHFPNALV